MDDANEVRELLIKIGRRLKRPPEDIEVYVNRIVNDNWLDTLDSLRQLTDEQWHELALPLRLLNLLKESLAADVEKTEEKLPGSTRSSDDVQTANSGLIDKEKSLPTKQELSDEKLSPKGEALNLATPSSAVSSDEGVNKTETDSTVQYAVPPDSLFDGVNLYSACEQLKELPEDVFPEVVKVLLKLVDGVLRHPKDLKKRKLRKVNKLVNDNIVRYKPASTVMKSIGFIEDEDSWFLDVAYIARLTDCHHLLCLLLKNRGHEAPSMPSSSHFNPFCHNYTSKTIESISKIKKSFGDEPASAPDDVSAALKERKLLLQTGGSSNISLNPRLANSHNASDDSSELANSLLRQNSNRENAGAAPDVYSPEEHEADAFLNSSVVTPGLVDQILSIKKVLSNGSGNFKSRARDELSALERRKIFEKCSIKFFFPNKEVFHLSFKPSDTVSHVKETLAQFLLPTVSAKDWTLCETPPLRYLNDSKTLYQEGLVPAAILHFRLKNEDPSSSTAASFPNYINKEVILRFESA